MKVKIIECPEKFWDYVVENGQLYQNLWHRADDEDYFPWKLCDHSPCRVRVDGVQGERHGDKIVRAGPSGEAAAGYSRGRSRCEAGVVGSENPAGWTFGRGRSRILSWFADWKQAWLIMSGGSAVPLWCRIGGTSERSCRLTGWVSETRRVLPLRCKALVGELWDLPPNCAGGLTERWGGIYMDIAWIPLPRSGGWPAKSLGEKGAWG